MTSKEELRAALTDALREVEYHNNEYKYVTPADKIAEWRRLCSVEPADVKEVQWPFPSETVAARHVLEKAGGHLGELVTAIAEQTGMTGVRRLVVSEELGLRIGVTPNAPARVMTPCGVVTVVADRDAPVQVTKGLLDALNLSMNMTGTHVMLSVDGLPGLFATLRVEAAREVQVVLGELLGPPAEPPVGDDVTTKP